MQWKDLTAQGTSIAQFQNLSRSVGCPDFFSAFYAANTTSDAPFLSFSLTKGTAYAYIAVHFAKLYLPTDSYALLRGVEHWDHDDFLVNLTDSVPSGVSHLDFIAPPIQAKELRIEFYRSSYTTPDADNSAGNCYGFVIDSYYYVMVNAQEQNLKMAPADEEICVSDNSKAAPCFYSDSTTRTAYLAARAVARLTIVKNGNTVGCTGWLIGSAGHIITNNHCIKDQTEASATTIEFMADGTTCSNDCMQWAACPGQVEALSALFVYTSASLDYTLIKAQTTVDLPKKYGFLRLKTAQGRLGQQVFIPQHPHNYGKRIAMTDDQGQHMALTDLSATYSNCAGVGYAYTGDTDVGSSGSPVIDLSDYGVVALHHCGVACANKGVPSVTIISDMTKCKVLPPMATDQDGKPNTQYFPAYTAPPIPPPKPLNSRYVLNSAIQLSADKSFVTVDKIAFTISDNVDISFDILSEEVSDDYVFSDVNGDCKGQYMDSIIFLFPDGDSTVIFSDDDSNQGEGVDDGSVSLHDSYKKTSLRKGSYVLAVTAMPAKSTDAFNGKIPVKGAPELYTCNNHGSYGTYRLTILSSSPVRVTSAPSEIAAPKKCSTPASSICKL
ncbi:TPA: hypothetical protein N0F65_013047 [Lagenidium giganteum]|uniref:Serine protease n=1 Tax=Lagenidium giganteum TaxID=4803 RepID=A0AAV2YPL8_9STRA|nr:TPA: hypothetical protein N0F65_013047 [Lagenidium giganteum]